jgi:hypothetical protein
MHGFKGLDMAMASKKPGSDLVEEQLRGILMHTKRQERLESGVIVSKPLAPADAVAEGDEEKIQELRDRLLLETDLSVVVIPETIDEIKTPKWRH